MTSSTPQDDGNKEVDLNELKSSIDLVAHINSKGIELKKNGSRDLIGLCPFHEETKPSFVVTPHKGDGGLWHCMGCGKGGSIIDFVMESETVDFRGALEVLQAR